MKQEPPLVVLLGLPFHDLTLEEALDECEGLMKEPGCHYLVTANVDFTTQADADVDLRKIVFFADRVVCDGMPLVWLSKLFGKPLRERVAGSDMVPRLLEICSRQGLPVYFFGSDLRTLEQAAVIAAEKYPGLIVAGCDAPPMGAVVEWDNEAICAKMKASGAKLLLVCLGCPKQERWIFAHHRDTGVPLSIGVGASLDFITGKQVRAPGWMQKCGLEWFWRMAGDPRRLVARYAKDFRFLVRAAMRQARVQAQRDKLAAMPAPAVAAAVEAPAIPAVLRLVWSGAVEKGRHEGAPLPAGAIDRPILLDAAAVSFMDSGGLGRLAALLRLCRTAGQELFVVAPSSFVTKALAAARMDTLVTVVDSERMALDGLAERTAETRIQGAGETMTVTFSHPLDALHLAGVVEALEQAEGKAAKALVVDLGAVDFVDSRAVGTLIRFHKRMLAKGGALYLYRPTQAVREILHLLRLDQILSEWKKAV